MLCNEMHVSLEGAICYWKDQTESEDVSAKASPSTCESDIMFVSTQGKRNATHAYVHGSVNLPLPCCMLCFTLVFVACQHFVPEKQAGVVLIPPSMLRHCLFHMLIQLPTGICKPYFLKMLLVLKNTKQMWRLKLCHTVATADHCLCLYGVLLLSTTL